MLSLPLCQTQTLLTAAPYEKKPCWIKNNRCRLTAPENTLIMLVIICVHRHNVVASSEMLLYMTQPVPLISISCLNQCHPVPLAVLLPANQNLATRIDGDCRHQRHPPLHESIPSVSFESLLTSSKIHSRNLWLTATCCPPWSLNTHPSDTPCFSNQSNIHAIHMPGFSPDAVSNTTEMIWYISPVSFLNRPVSGITM